MKITYTVKEVTNALGEQWYTIHRKRHWVDKRYLPSESTWENAMKAIDYNWEKPKETQLCPV